MIALKIVENISPILLTILLITYLVLAELGNSRIKKNLTPLLIVLIAVFLIIVVVDIMSKL